MIRAKEAIRNGIYAGWHGGGQGETKLYLQLYLLAYVVGVGLKRLHRGLQALPKGAGDAK